MSIADATVSEGASGTRTIDFKVVCSCTRSQLVHYHTVNGSATAPSDFLDDPDGTVYARTAADLYGGENNLRVKVNGDTESNSGMTMATFTITRAGSKAGSSSVLFEDTEGFTVKLTSPIGATIADGSGAGRIDNDDPAFRISDETGDEYPNNNGKVTFSIERLGPKAGTASVVFSTADGTARAGSDCGRRDVPLASASPTIQVSQPTSRADPPRLRADPRRGWAHRRRGSRGPPARPRSLATYRAGRAPRPTA